MTRFIRVGQSNASLVSRMERKSVFVRPHLDDNGYIQNAGLKFRPIAALENGTIDGPHAIILHRTFSSTAASTLASFGRGIGTHFLVAKDGTIYQCASLKQKTAHVGPIRSRCLVEGTCSAQEAVKIRSYGAMAGHRHEKVKPYPARYPMNEDSIGIETVAMYLETTKQWEPATGAQRKAISSLVKLLQSMYSLTDADVYEHDQISRKTEGEGAGLYDGPGGVPARFPPPFF